MGSQSAGIGSALPDQNGYSGYILTTDGVTASWEASSASLPSQGGNSGKYLTTNGTVASWGVVTADSLLPSQTGKNGDVLGTNGTTVAWVSASGITVAAVGAAPNANGMTLTGAALNLEPASVSAPGVVIVGDQTFGTGAKVIGGISLQPTSAFGSFPAIVMDSGANLGIYSSSGVMIINCDTIDGIQCRVGSSVRVVVGVAALDLTGMGVGGAIKLKSPDGTTYTATIANGGTWNIA